jgi:microcystin-dependent protein
MPINPALLIAAPMLQDAFVDKDGTPMSSGTVTCYQDNSRTTLKNWYFQSGTPGNYTYIALPNPLTLSAAGTICTADGIDTIPFFYPYSELDQTVSQPYYITIVNYAQTNQITRANFPYNREETTPTAEVESFDNYIINNVFWRNIGTMTLTNVTDTVVAPSQHDGFSAPDITFMKNVTGGQDTVTFTKFPLSTGPILTGDITPEFYLNHVCTNSIGGENQKCYQFPISLHVNTLNSVPFTVTIQAQNAGGTSTGENVITLFLWQYTGTGTSGPSPIPLGSITLNSAWTKYEFTSIFPSTAGLTLASTGDDAYYLQVQMPLNLPCNINFTLPSLYLSTSVPTNNFQTYDQIDPIINGFRTGDIRISLNSFAPYGWVAANDGTIGPVGSGATRANVDTWPLYNLLWNAVSQTYAPVSSGSRGATAYADWSAGYTIALTKALSRALGVVGPGSGLTDWALGQTTGTESVSTTLLEANLPPHTHQYNHVASSGSSVSSGVQLGVTGLFNTGPGNGTSTPFSTSTIQPSVFYNAFFKL